MGDYFKKEDDDNGAGGDVARNRNIIVAEYESKDMLVVGLLLHFSFHCL